jgi:3-oxoacyl-[acyl-carrier protein] reductase
MQCDITLGEDVDQLHGKVRELYGGLDVLVNNAGVWRGGLLVDLPADHWREVLETNLLALFTITRPFLADMVAERTGRIVNIASIVGITGNAGDTAYSASKGGMIAFTRSLAQEVARFNIAVNAIAPGPIETDMTKQLTTEQMDNFVRRIPMRRSGAADEVADVVTYLSRAPLYLTGAVIRLAGGA